MKNGKTEVEEALETCKKITNELKGTKELNMETLIARVAERQKKKNKNLKVKFEGKGLSVFGPAAQLEVLAMETARRSGNLEFDEAFKSLSTRARVQNPALASEKLGKAEKMREESSTIVNLNVATSDILCTLTGIGPAKAAMIISTRPFEKIEDLMKVSGIGQKTFEKLKKNLAV